MSAASSSSADTAGLQALVQAMWSQDENMARAPQDFRINKQGRMRYGCEEDVAAGSLFEYVTPEVLQRPTYRAFISLLDNYNAVLGQPEEVTAGEIQEMNVFLDTILTTRVMRLAHEFAVQHGLVKDTNILGEFRRKIYDIWFKLYRRTRGVKALDSSSFEHVFVGEQKGDDEIVGMHNWIQIYLQEQAGNLDYRGFFENGTTNEPDGCPALLSIQFNWRGLRKAKASTFLGASPEFEIALYTIIFLWTGCQGSNSPIRIVLDDYHTIDVFCHSMGPGRLGSCYIKAIE